MSPRKKLNNAKRAHPYARYVLCSGIGLILTGLLLFILIFFPVIQLEFSYRLHTVFGNKSSPSQEVMQPLTVTPVDLMFGIVIPKIGANAKIIPNVNPYDSTVYQQALTKGVAHAQGSVFPGRVGNMFVFSHSSVNFYEAMRFNSVFYLLNKLTHGDLVYIFYNNNQFIYQVFETMRINPTNLSYLTEKTSSKLLTLMTCWPPGTTFERLIVRAQLVE